MNIQVGQVASPIELVEQSVYFVEQRHKPQLLTHFLQNTAVHADDRLRPHEARGRQDREDIWIAPAFVPPQSTATRARTFASARWTRFKSNRPPVLVATDIAARGLDVNGISHVINYELPEVAGDLRSPHRPDRPRRRDGHRHDVLRPRRTRPTATDRTAHAQDDHDRAEAARVSESFAAGS